MSVAFLERAGRDAVRFDGCVLSVSRGLCHASLVASDTRTGHTIAHGQSSFLMGVYAGGLAGAIQDWPPHTVGTLADARSYDEEIGTRSADGVCRLPFHPNLVGSRNPDMLHGGAIAAGLIASARSDPELPDGQQLSSLSIEFLKGGLERETIFTSSAVHSGRSASAFEISAGQEDDRRIAVGLARFTDFTGE